MANRNAAIEKNAGARLACTDRRKDRIAKVVYTKVRRIRQNLLPANRCRRTALACPPLVPQRIPSEKDRSSAIIPALQLRHPPTTENYSEDEAMGSLSITPTVAARIF